MKKRTGKVSGKSKEKKGVKNEAEIGARKSKAKSEGSRGAVKKTQIAKTCRRKIRTQKTEG